MTSSTFGLARRWLVVAAAGLALGVAGCGSDDDSSSTGTGTGSASSGSSGAEVEQLKVILFPTTDAAPFFVALDNGIFEKHQLEVEHEIVVDATAMTAAVTSGKADVMHQSLPTAAIAISSGLPLKLFSGVTNMPTDGYVEVLVDKDSDVQDFAGLADKTAATVVLHGIFDLGTRAAMQAEGADPDSLKSLAMATPDEPAALESGRVDAIAINDPFLGPAKANPKFRSLGNPFGALDYTAISSSAYASEKGIAEKGEALQRYREALAEAVEMIEADPEAARKAMVKNTETPPEVMEAVTLPEYTTDVSAEDLDAVVGTMDEFGWLDEAITADDILWTEGQ